MIKNERKAKSFYNSIELIFTETQSKACGNYKLSVQLTKTWLFIILQKFWRSSIGNSPIRFVAILISGVADRLLMAYQ